MSAEIVRDAWSGDGDFTQHLVDHLRNWPPIATIRVEDAPTGREGEGFNFLANDVFLTFAVRPVRQPAYAFWRRQILATTASTGDLVAYLTAIETIGEPAYHDEGMLQYLHTQRIVGPYQSKGVKLVELVRVYVGKVAP
jgi:hypothetical protein